MHLPESQSKLVSCLRPLLKGNVLPPSPALWIWLSSLALALAAQVQTWEGHTSLASRKEAHERWALNAAIEILGACDSIDEFCGSEMEKTKAIEDTHLPEVRRPI